MGKTWLVVEFAKSQYKNIAYVNFEEQVFLRGLFAHDYNVNRIIEAISATTHEQCIPGETLIFLDEIAMQWLIDGGLVHKVSNVTAPRLPLRAYVDKGAFKLFVVDVGLLGAMAALDSRTVTDGNRIFTELKGAMTEQYVLQQLMLKHTPYYYAKANSQQEIDFLIEDSGKIVPIEVKAEENLKAKSLRQFVADNNSEQAYRKSMSPYRKEEWLTNIPLYGVGGIL